MNSKNKYLIDLVIVAGLFFVSLLGCENENEVQTIMAPIVSTNDINNITVNSAICGGNISDDGGADILAKGVCWGVNQNPTISNNSTNDGIGVGGFISEITSLDVNTTYYVRAYATNSKETTYGNEQSFLTLNGLPSGITTISISDTTATSAISGGAITDDGGFDITSKGVCWSTDQNPTIENSITSDGNGTDDYTSNITGLNVNTTYYVRAYATNENGTAYGNEIILTTLDGLPNGITTTSISDTTATSAISGGNINDDGGFNITSKGVCWSTNQSPTVENNVTNDGNGVGSYTSNIVGLNINTTYYVRAYATNENGTAYGDEIIFTTLSGLPRGINTIPISEITPNSAKSGGNINSDGGFTIVAKGLCWSTNPNPTEDDYTTNVGSGMDNFISIIPELNPETKYYVRAYASNENGTAYGNEVDFTTIKETVTDLDGNIYETVKIGEQIWMAENLKTSKLNDGTSIPFSDKFDYIYSQNPIYCWYDKDESYKEPYGALYNWYTVNTDKLCPDGWHVPSVSEWEVLINYLGGDRTIIGGILKEDGIVHWKSPNTGATNELGFSALPGGYAYDSFKHIYENGYYWTSTISNQFLGHAFAVLFGTYSATISISEDINMQSFGYSVRCLKD